MKLREDNGKRDGVRNYGTAGVSFVLTGSALFGGFLGGFGGQPFVEGDGEGEESCFVVGGVDHLDVDLGAFEGVARRGFDVVEEVAGEGGVGVDGGALEAEVGVVLGDFFVDGVVVDGDGDDGDLGALGAPDGEDAAVDVFEGRRRGSCRCWRR